MVRVGTSGFSYTDWQTVFYPAGLAPGERLPFYARRFATVELNTTFYRQPAPALTAALAAKVGPAFRFSVKAYGGLTHDHTQATAADFRRFAAGLAPLARHGQLGAVLCQFPNAFRPSLRTREYLQRVRDAWPDWPLVVEFRHADWHQPETYAWLRSVGLGVCNVDEPDLPGLLPPSAELTAGVGYVRFHGRNRERWYQHREAWERYDYLYTSAELAEWLPSIKTLAERADDLYVYFNNHYVAQAVTNAAQLLDMLGVERVDGDV